jgi:hypothetical protein
MRRSSSTARPLGRRTGSRRTRVYYVVWGRWRASWELALTTPRTSNVTPRRGVAKPCSRDRIRDNRATNAAIASARLPWHPAGGSRAYVVPRASVHAAGARVHRTVASCTPQRCGNVPQRRLAGCSRLCACRRSTCARRRGIVPPAGAWARARARRNVCSLVLQTDQAPSRLQLQLSR